MSAREVPLVGGPGDGERVQVHGGASVMPAIRWSGPDPDAQVVAGFDPAGAPDDAVVFARPAAQAIYHHLVAMRQDAHPCKAGAFMVAEWDAYVWDQVRDLEIPDDAMHIPPSRFRVTDGHRYRLPRSAFDRNAHVRRDLETVRDTLFGSRELEG